MYPPSPASLILLAFVATSCAKTVTWADQHGKPLVKVNEIPRKEKVRERKPRHVPVPASNRLQRTKSVSSRSRDMLNWFDSHGTGYGGYGY